MRALIPSLTIQPLLENAIYHGIELLPDGGEVIVSGQRIGDQLHMEISNPVPQSPKAKKAGNKMALMNIRQRFELAYGNKASITVEESADLYSVKIVFPYGEYEA